jgi:hypothetical protein
MTKLKEAFEQCLRDKVYPGPTALNERMGKGKCNRLNGRECSLRLDLMAIYGIPYQRSTGAYGRKGEVPARHGITL